MNAAEVREAVKANEEACLEMGHSLSLDDLGRIAQTVFPAGSLPDESTPLQFTARELEILRHIEWQTKKTRARFADALMARKKGNN